MRKLSREENIAWGVGVVLAVGLFLLAGAYSSVRVLNPIDDQFNSEDFEENIAEPAGDLEEDNLEPAAVEDGVAEE